MAQVTKNLPDKDGNTIVHRALSDGSGNVAMETILTINNDSDQPEYVSDANPAPVKITDGTRTASVRDTGSSDSLNVAIVDGSGAQITSFGGGTQYTEGDTDASITGTALLFEDAANTLVAAPGTAADGLLVNLGTNNDVTATQSGTWTVTGTGGTFPVTDSGGSLTVDGTVTANLAAGTNNIGDVDVITVPAPLSTTGGGTEATALRVTLANNAPGFVADNAGFTDGTTVVSMAGYIFDETAGTSLTENDAAAARIDSKRALVYTLEDATTRGQRQSVNAAGAASITSVGYQSTTTITRGANTTPYTDNDVIGGALTLSNIGPSGGHIMLNSIRILLNITAVPSGMSNMILFLYDATPPSAVADNGAFSVASGDRSNLLTPNGISLGTPTLGVGGGTVVLQANNLALQFKLASASTALYAYLVTKAFTPAANSETYTMTVQAMGI